MRKRFTNVWDQRKLEQNCLAAWVIGAADSQEPNKLTTNNDWLRDNSVIECSSSKLCKMCRTLCSVCSGMGFTATFQSINFPAKRMASCICWLWKPLKNHRHHRPKRRNWSSEKITTMHANALRVTRRFILMIKCLAEIDMKTSYNYVDEPCAESVSRPRRPSAWNIISPRQKEVRKR